MKRILGVLLATMVGCGGHSSQDQSVSVNTEWTPNSVQLSCPTGDCPEGVGLVLFVEHGDDGYVLYRCTATLISATAILTNAHCGKKLNHIGKSYFFTLARGKTIVRDLGENLSELSDHTEGEGRDHAFYSLKEAVTEITPRKISRKAPRDQSKLVAYVVNEPDESGRFEKFNIDRRECSTEKSIAVVDQGSKDHGVALALFGCDIRLGNSGSPVFADGDFTTVQMLVHSRVFGASVDTHLGPYFLEAPSFITKSHGIAERLYCQNLFGETRAAEECPHESSKKEISRIFGAGLSRTADRWWRDNSKTRTLTWTADLFALAPQNGSFRADLHHGVVFVPRPLCWNSRAIARQASKSRVSGSQSILYLQLGVNEQGELGQKPIREDSAAWNFSPLGGGRFHQASLDIFSVAFLWDSELSTRLGDQIREARAAVDQRELELPICSVTLKQKARQDLKTRALDLGRGMIQ